MFYQPFNRLTAPQSVNTLSDNYFKIIFTSSELHIVILRRVPHLSSSATSLTTKVFHTTFYLQSHNFEFNADMILRRLVFLWTNFIKKRLPEDEEKYLFALCNLILLPCFFHVFHVFQVLYFFSLFIDSQTHVSIFCR